MEALVALASDVIGAMSISTKAGIYVIAGYSAGWMLCCQIRIGGPTKTVENLDLVEH